jgi:hypothetical protein
MAVLFADPSRRGFAAPQDEGVYLMQEVQKRNPLILRSEPIGSRREGSAASTTIITSTDELNHNG